MDSWNGEVKGLLRAELGRRNITHERLVELLKAIGVHETRASVSSKLSRGSFKATFLLQCLHAIRSNDPVRYVAQLDLLDNRLREFHTALGTKLGQHLTVFENRLSGVRYIDAKTHLNSSLPSNSVISLFTGAGGLDIGLEAAGFESAACVEIDADCRATLRYNRPHWKIFEEDTDRQAGDIRSIRVEELLAFGGLRSGEAALVVGGAPCQPFSNIGKRFGKDDPRNGDLFIQFVRIVDGVRPRAFIFENVAGIAQSRHSEVVDYMYAALNGLGYSLSHTVLNAANYGVPQRRERFFLIGLTGDEKPCFPLPTHAREMSNWDEFARLLDPTPVHLPEKWISLKQAFASIPPNYREREDYVCMNISTEVVNRMKRIGPGQNFKVLPMSMRPKCWREGRHQGQDTFGRLRIDEPSVTIRTAAYNPSKGMYIHPTENRGLNSVEMATIQGFPPEWVFKSAGGKKVTLVSAGKQIGNAVPPKLACAIGNALRIQMGVLTG